jgi:hypothetical protein
VVSKILAKEKKYFLIGEAILECLQAVTEIPFSEKIAHIF